MKNSPRMVCVLCVAFVYYSSSSTVPAYRTTVRHGRRRTERGLSTISQRCGTVRALKRHAMLRLSSGASGVGIEASCVEISRETSFVQIRTRTEVSPRSRNVAAPFERGNVVLCEGDPPVQAALESQQCAWRYSEKHFL